jgi:hypothetical protein
MNPSEKAIRESQIHWARGRAIDEALVLLRRARDLLVGAKAPRAATKVRLALTSTEGAKRNADGQATRVRVPMCVAAMHCLCAGHARGAAVDAACNTSETS